MATARIDLAALRKNFSFLKSMAPASSTMTLLKANAYGHGLIEVATALKTSELFAVARVEEAEQLRARGFTKDILVLDGFLNEQEFTTVQDLALQVVVHDFSQVEILEKINDQSEDKSQVNVPVWLKANTGMNRLGFRVDDELAEAYSRLQKCAGINLEVLLSHFANADLEDNTDTKKVLLSFEKAKQLCLDISKYSLSNSAALFSCPESYADWNRPGISLYGCSTLGRKPTELLPVMQLTAPVIAIQTVKAGESVGYGSNWTASKDTQIAVIGIGYGDGYPRHANNGTPVQIANTLYPLAGRVSMDMITVDLEDNKSKVCVGDVAVLFGSELLSADQVAQHADTISYELFCNVSTRVRREYVNG